MRTDIPIRSNDKGDFKSCQEKWEKCPWLNGEEVDSTPYCNLFDELLYKHVGRIVCCAKCSNAVKQIGRWSKP